MIAGLEIPRGDFRRRNAQFASYSTRRSSGVAPRAATDPGTQVFDRFNRRKFGPLSASPVGIFVVFVLTAILVVSGLSTPPGTTPSDLISEMLHEGDVLREKVTKFYQQHRRLPQPSQTTEFQLMPSELRQAQSVVWDPVGRMIVVTAGEPQPGKRFALHAEERSGVLHWTCRTIDFPVNRLPGRCR